MNSTRWLVSTLDLGHPLPELSPAPDAGGIHLQIWLGDLPLGQLWLANDTLPMTPDELAREVAAAIAPTVGDRLFTPGFRGPIPVPDFEQTPDGAPDLAALLENRTPLGTAGQEFTSHVMERTGAPTSVIVCTRNRPDALRRCLASLMALNPAPMEILVVDNAPDRPDTRAVGDAFPGVTWIPEARPGLSRARNAGLRHARGEILAWTDDDTTVHPRWIGAIQSVFADPTLSAMTGLVLAGSLETSAQLRFERDFGGFQRGYRPFTLDREFFEKTKARGVPTWIAGAGANMAFRRTVFDRLGPFDERLGAGAAGCSEDSEYWYRILAEGGSIRYEPTAVVNHFHRITEDDFQFQMQEYMRGHVAALLFQYQKYGHPGNLHRVFVGLPRYYLSVARQRLAGAARGTLASEVRGCLWGILFSLRNRD